MKYAIDKISDNFLGIYLVISPTISNLDEAPNLNDQYQLLLFFKDTQKVTKKLS